MGLQERGPNPQGEGTGRTVLHRDISEMEMEMGGGSAKAIKKKKTALPWKCSHLGGGEDGKKRGSSNSGMGAPRWGEQVGGHTQDSGPLRPGCREGFLEQRVCRQAENRSYLAKSVPGSKVSVLEGCCQG